MSLLCPYHVLFKSLNNAFSPFHHSTIKQLCCFTINQSIIKRLAASFGCKAASLSKLACIIKQLRCVTIFLIFVSIKDACFRERLACVLRLSATVTSYGCAVLSGRTTLNVFISSPAGQHRASLPERPSPRLTAC